MARTNREVALDMLQTGTHTAAQIGKALKIKTASARHLIGRLRAEGNDIVHNFNGYTLFVDPADSPEVLEHDRLVGGEEDADLDVEETDEDDEETDDAFAV